MTLADILSTDLDNVFYNTDEFAVSAVWTPSGGVAQPAFEIFLNDALLRGDDEQDRAVTLEEVTARGKWSDISGVNVEDKITANSVDYIAITPAYQDEENSGEGFLDLRRKNQRLI